MNQMSSETVGIPIETIHDMCHERTTVYGQEVVCSLQDSHRGRYHKGELYFNNNSVELMIQVRWRNII